MIDDDCNDAYDVRTIKKGDSWERGIIEDKLKDEMSRGILLKSESKPTCVHSIFVVPKDDGGGRSMVDCSKLVSFSINSFTKGVAPQFRYKGLNDVVENLEKGDMLASIDIKDTHRAVHIHPSHWERQGLKWVFMGEDTPTYLLDTRLCMGLSSSPYIFSCISDFIVRCVSREGVRRIMNYLDDFCIIGSNYEQASHFQLWVIGILRHLVFLYKL